ncbi:DUF4190 domain-containing protein [Mangrovihabitans endophyticus]|uniref:DUF4190 domain-containing protein n=1 Tax=Mangrovihabitans endophyticus TaxID=1751298 RepID=A0A8J3BYI0_9ACTN|nr:DUF4190 domain-containing protein [Mangrovihabitans endophyticus]GGK89003.1 hypothetical protein GCM10012284_23820 [Mangrovihabitans endophyticus]
MTSGTAARQRTSRWAIASLVLGLAALFFFVLAPLGLPLAVLTIIVGGCSILDIRRNDTGGYGLAAAGILLGIIALGIIATTAP